MHFAPLIGGLLKTMVVEGEYFRVNGARYEPVESFFVWSNAGPPKFEFPSRALKIPHAMNFSLVAFFQRHSSSKVQSKSLMDAKVVVPGDVDVIVDRSGSAA